MDVFSTKSNSTSMKIDYFGQKKWKSQITHCGQNVKLDLQKTFIPPICNTTFLREMSKTIRRLIVFSMKSSYFIKKWAFLTHFGQILNFSHLVWALRVAHELSGIGRPERII